MIDRILPNLYLVVLLCCEQLEGDIVPLSLSGQFNNDGIAFTDEHNGGNFDSHGFSYPAEKLPKSGIINLIGIQFIFPSKERGMNNNILCLGQSIPVPPDNYSAIYLLGAGSNGNFQKELIVKYLDGSEDNLQIGFTDWCFPLTLDEIKVIRCPYRIKGNGTQENIHCYIFFQAVKVDSTKKLSSIKLPFEQNLHIFSVSLTDEDVNLEKLRNRSLRINRIWFAAPVASLYKDKFIDFDWNSLEKLSEDSLLEVEKRIATFFPKWFDSSTIHILPNSHIDLEWLWTFDETVNEILPQTFSAHLKAMDEDSSYRYAQSQAVLYKTAEENYPDIFKKIVNEVKKSKWEIVGGAWVESDMNMPSGEALVRQYLYGKKYLKEKFGVDVNIGWCPDAFGHTWTLPQILKKSGINSYVFCRCPPGENIFWWESPDGSRVLGYCPPGWYNIHKFEPHLIYDALKIMEKYNIRDVGILWGQGDHGGFPTFGDIKEMKILDGAVGGLKVKFSTPSEFLSKVLTHSNNFPTVRKELNFTGQGCYGFCSQVKWNNRQAENRLVSAEKFAVIASLFGSEYPQKLLEEAWQNLLFNQFHDILASMAIPEVFLNAKSRYQRVFDITDEVLNNSLGSIAGKINTEGEGIPVVVFNPLSFARTNVVEVYLEKDPRIEEKEWIVISDENGKTLPSQVLESIRGGVNIIFIAHAIPSMGGKTFWVSASNKLPNWLTDLTASITTLENKYFRIEIDEGTGYIVSIFDKERNREVIRHNSLANRLEFLEDEGNTATISYTGKHFFTKNRPNIELVESGPLRAKLRIVHQFRKSKITQEILLCSCIPRVDFTFNREWTTSQGVSLKVIFPLALKSPTSHYEIPYGVIERASNGDEYPALNWVDISTLEYGVALLNDGRYGFDIKDSNLRITLLRDTGKLEGAGAGGDPAPESKDKGNHTLRYALYPHQGDWRAGLVVNQGYEFNTPLISLIESNHTGVLPSTFSFVKVEHGNALITAMKKSEFSSGIIVRLYEPYGDTTGVEVNFVKPPKLVKLVNLIEQEQGILGNREGCPYTINPFELKTLEVSF